MLYLCLNFHHPSVFGCPAGFHQVGTDACTFDCPLPLLSSSDFDAVTTMIRYCSLNREINWLTCSLKCCCLAIVICHRVLAYHVAVGPSKTTVPCRLGQGHSSISHTSISSVDILYYMCNVYFVFVLSGQYDRMDWDWLFEQVSILPAFLKSQADILQGIF